MERDSLLYRTRRAGQVMAHKLFSDNFMSKVYYRIVLGKKLDLGNPRTFNEKIQWLKLNYFHQDKKVVCCADKYKVREYIEKKGYGDTLTPLLGCWDRADEIDWSKLPNQFVLKCNHGCAYNIVVPDKSKADKKAITKQLNKWLKEDFGAFNIELHYSEIHNHKIICEKFLGDDIMDYKFFCFNGEPKYIYVSNDLIHDRQAQIGFFYIDGKKMPLKRDDYNDISEIKLPAFFNEMLDISKDLSTEFPFVRVDFFLANDRYYFAELTYTPGAGMMPFNPEKYDLEWGNLIDLSRVIDKVKG